jgi:hypothetical protein
MSDAATNRMKRAAIIVCMAFAGMLAGTCAVPAATEYVTVVKVLENDDKGVIERENGERWLIEKGVGAISFWRYEGKRVLINSPGLFCGVGSKVILPNDDQEARIWNAERLPDDVKAPAPASLGHDEAVNAATRALAILKYYDTNSADEEKRDLRHALSRFQTDNSLSETNTLGPKAFVKLAELVLRERGDSVEGLGLARTLIDSAKQMKEPPQSHVLPMQHTDEGLIETSIKSVTRDGTIITLTDGSIYEVDPLDRIKTSLWLPLENVLKRPGGLTNLDSGESASANILK